MKNMHKKIMNYGFKTLSILVFGAMLMPTITSASNEFLGNFGGSSNGSYYSYSGNSYNGYVNPNYYSYQQSYYQPPIYTPPPVAPTPTPIVYSTTVNPNRAVAVTSDTNTKKTTNKSALSSKNVSSLAANAFYGSNSFLPSGLVQWVLFGIFILLLVILARIVLGSKEKYLATPLKHE